MRKQPIRMFDVFCGGGGSSQGAIMAGVVPAAALDKWSIAAQTYRQNFPDAVVYETTAGSLSPKQVSRDVGRIDLMLASPECTSHSVAKGNKPRCEESRATAFDVIRFAEELRPRWLVVENVMQMQKWYRFAEWRQSLERIGYNLDMCVLNAQYFGAPQSRRRLFIVGDLEGIPSL
ncbi:MAG: DNA cytosine methyltransferase, partial [Candidatus Alcyoniella australis]|nr:DNA cytosine methyltransferase [Candidatus Alcyoniella australis]